MKKLFIGCDIAKNKIDFCVLKSSRTDSYYGQFENSFEGFEQFLKTVATLYPFCDPYIAMESTSSYTFSFQKYLSDNSINHVLLNARRVNKYTKSMVIQGKTDKTDSFALSHFCSILDESEFTQNYSMDRETLLKYVAVIRQFRKQKTQIKNLYKSVQEGEIVPALNIELNKLKKSLETREKEVKKEAEKILVEVYPVCDYLRENHLGVSYSLLLILVPRIYDNIENYSVNSTVAFLGLNPTQFQSGQFTAGNRLNIFGDSDVKHLLFMSVFSNLSRCELTKSKYAEFKSRGKTHKQSMVALMRQLLVVLIRSMKRYKKEN